MSSHPYSDADILAEPKVPRKKRRFRPIAFASLVAIFLLWELAAHLIGTNEATGASIVPSIEDTIGAFKSYAYNWKGGLGAGNTQMGAPLTYWGAILGLGYNTLFTLMRVFGGLVPGIITGIGLAFLISWSRVLREMISFPANFLRMMPILAMVPLFSLWFGGRAIGVVIFVSFATFVLLFVITINAIGNVPTYYSQYARSLGASQLRTYIAVIFPAAFPQLRGGILLAIGFSWSCTIAGEFMGQQTGLGRITMFALEYARIDTIALTAIITVAISATTFLIASKILMWLTRWAE
jgi:ABC-type nitrate/sulfonate/bicarbonate transport system permease component